MSNQMIMINKENSKHEIRNPKQIQISKSRNFKQYDLEDCTLEFARKIRLWIKKLFRNAANIEDIKQLIRSSGSVGANYIEANEALSKRDFIHRIKICRKEAKESRYWLFLLDLGGNQELEKERKNFIQEAKELMNIFGSIIRKSE